MQLLEFRLRNSKTLLHKCLKVINIINNLKQWMTWMHIMSHCLNVTLTLSLEIKRIIHDVKLMKSIINIELFKCE